MATTESGVPFAPLYDADSLAGTDPAQIGAPGEYPFTRGVYPSMYRGRLWTMRQYSGFGDAASTNERFHFLLDAFTEVLIELGEGAVAAALRLSAEVSDATIVSIICDRGDRYLSTGVFAA